MAEHVHTIVIGGGVVGLAIARRLAMETGELLVFEREATIGTQTSSRNSEVIHAGMYYEQGSRKARSCVQGRRLLYDYCAEFGVGHRRVGKLIVATAADELPQLRKIADRAAANGLTREGEALIWLDSAAAQAIEPALKCFGALWSPSTGIVDTHGLMLSYLGEAERRGAAMSPCTDVVGATRDGTGWRVQTRGGDGSEFEVSCTHLVNAAGLQAQRVAYAIDGLDPGHVPPALWLKGNYFTVAGQRPPFSHLIYPVPHGGGLGIHLTLDLAGQARFGPDTEPVDPETAAADRPDYRVDPARAAAFYAAIRRYWPSLQDGALQPAYAGIRPKVRLPGHSSDANDFVLSGPRHHGLPGLVQLFGIESPGITASLALADDVAAVLRSH